MSRKDQFAEAIGDDTLNYTLGKGDDDFPRSFEPTSKVPPSPCRVFQSG